MYQSHKYADALNARIIEALSVNRSRLTDEEFEECVNSRELVEHFSAIINKSYIVELISYDDYFILEISNNYNYELYNVSQLCDKNISQETFTHFYLCDNILDAYARINNAILLSFQYAIT
jgi:hypothetical protein